ncbi:hypothetical protein F511_23654 [Dorcoceras hygrometricum]|uniref:Transposase (Putative), gypsy type n=1 Tax=Dorcoceras hygrometricum TaxID=472368 RepID=A0A2Z7CFP4_9LAMI|nr:hypothetical protein F511_23654 [Dorcoceras hygrometricum]
MASIDERLVVATARSLGSTSSSESEDTSSPPSKASRKRLLAGINADEARLTAEGRPWYEVRASLLQESDKATIKDLSGMSDHYEIVIPVAEDRAHLPPEGYHTFYLNQLEMGLRFPVPRFIQTLCDHFKVSPIQLTPNSYSSLLALGILLRFHQAPLSLHLIYSLTQIRQQDVGKFFIRFRPEFGFIKGNPTFHKGWMNRYFFLHRNAQAGVAWHCNMSWSEKPTRRAPPLPAQEYDPSSFLDSMSVRCFNAQDLIREDLLCYFGFSRKGVVVEGDLGTTKGPSPPPEERVKEKMKNSSSGGDKRPRKKTLSASDIDKEVETSLPDQPTVEVTSFITRPVTTTTVAFFQNFSPELDLPVINSASNQAITEALATNFMQALVWGGESSRRVSNAREVARSSKQSLDEMLVQHDKLMRELEDVRGASDAEKRSLEDKMTTSEASVARLQEEMKKMKGEVEATWENGKDDFLKSSEFDRLCSYKALYFLEKGFNGCLAQFRDNGYSETEHPASFLSILKALEDFPEECEVEFSFAPKE